MRCFHFSEALKHCSVSYTVLLRISARALIYFVHPLDPALIQAPALIYFIRYFDPALFFLFTTLTGTFICDTTENVSSIKKRIM